MTFTASVSSGGAPVGADGTVTFTDVTDSVTLCDTVSVTSSGTATCTDTGLTSGASDTIVATYSGTTSTYLASSASITQLVQSDVPTQLTLSSNDNDIECTFGECDDPSYDVTYTATVTASSGQPAGTVMFSDDGTMISGCTDVAVSTTSPYTASCADSYASPGNLDDTIVASLTPTAGELASSAEISEVIGTDQAESSTLSLTTSANPVVAGTSVTYTATVTGEFNGTPGGNVTFVDGGAGAGCSSGSDSVALDSSGVATCTISAGYASTGTEAIEAQYAGTGESGGYDDSYAAFDEAVTPSAATTTATTVSPSADPAPAGEVTYDVAVAASSGTPTGSVTVSDGTNTCMAALSSGAGGCTLDETSVSTLTVSASYPATDGFAASAASISELVTAIMTTATTTTVGESATSAPYGQENTVSFSVTVAPTDDETGPSGDVVTIDVGTTSCQATLSDGYGICPIGASDLAVGGPYAVSATFAGDADFSGSSSTNALDFSVTEAPASSTSLTTSLSGGGSSGTSISVPGGTAVTDQASLSGVNASEATGTVTYNVYSDSACTDLVNGGTAQPITTDGSLPASAPVALDDVNTYYWQAVYSGDSNNLTSTSTCGSETETVTAVSSAPQPTTLTTLLTGNGILGGSQSFWLGDLITVFDGTSVIDTATLSGTNASEATGTVTYTVFGIVFTDGSPFFRWGPVASGGTVTVVDGQIPPSNALMLPVGIYEWQASYVGDSNNAPSTSPFGSETTVVVPVTQCQRGWNSGWNPGCNDQQQNQGS